MAPWARSCSELGLDLGGLADDEIAYALVRLLGGGRGPLAPGLVDTLDRIDDMTSAEGLAALLGRLEVEGPDWTARELPPLHLAVWAWVSLRDRFEEAEARRRAERAGLVREYPVREGVVLRLPEQQEVDELAAAVGSYWHGRGRSSFCRVLVFREQDRVYLPIERGQALRTEPAVEADAAAAVTFRPRAIEVATFDERTRRVMIKADPAARPEYMQRIGEALFGDPTAIVEDHVVSLAPLAERGREALAPTPGLRDVQLVSLKMALGDRLRSVITISSVDVLQAIVEHELCEPGRAELVHARFLLRFQKGRRRKLELGPPNEIAFDRRRDEHVVLRFLEERGFLVSPGTVPTPPVPRTAQLGLWG